MHWDRACVARASMAIISKNNGRARAKIHGGSTVVLNRPTHRKVRLLFITLINNPSKMLCSRSQFLRRTCAFNQQSSKKQDVFTLLLAPNPLTHTNDVTSFI